jgi:PKD repeat protein
VVAFTASSPALAGAAVTFPNTSTGGPFTSVCWNFGASTPLSTAANPTHVFASAGTYPVRLTLTNGGGSANVVIPITVSPAISANFTVSASPRVGAPVTFTNTTTGGPFTSLSWTFQDGGTATGSPVTHTFTTAGTHNVTLAVVASSGATSSRTIAVNVAPVLPAASYSVTPVASPARTVTFTNTSTGAPFTAVTWRFGDGTADVVSAGPVTHTFTGSATSFAVRLTVENASGDDQVTTTVSLTPPVAAFTFAPLLRVVSFVNTSTGGPFSSVSWNFDDGSPLATTNNPSHTFAEAGSYDVTLTVTTGGGSSIEKHTVTVP